MTITVPTPFLWFLFDVLTSLPMWLMWVLSTEGMHWSKRYVLASCLFVLIEIGAEMSADKWS